mgnify:CR=1 FL=1|tara:strand:+ start:146 stop:304 length:159 start_codon:yes stop_codon:yes gene_type:complete
MNVERIVLFDMASFETTSYYWIMAITGWGIVLAYAFLLFKLCSFVMGGKVKQ